MEEQVQCSYYSEVKEKRIEWLWYPYIPYGKITIIQGDPGDGKSTFVLQLAAILTKSGKLPDNTAIAAPQTVIYQCAEDSIEDTIKPRLLQAGADCDKVAFIDDSEKNLTLDDARIRSAIQKTGAKLFVLDPIQAFIPPDCDMQSAARIRTVMRSLANVAEETGCAIVLIGHMNKGTGGKNLYRGLGSIDIAAIARSILMVSRDEENPEMRYIFPIKSSLAPEGNGISFLIDKETGFRWVGSCDRNNIPLMLEEKQGIGKKEKAKKLIATILSAQDMPSNTVYERLLQFGISNRTARIAGKELGIQAIRKNNIWYWHLDSEGKEEKA